MKHFDPYVEQYSGEVRKPVGGRFLLYLPQGFASHGATRYPLLIFLHGSGESGVDIDKVKFNGPPKFLDARTDFPFIVVSPQAASANVGFDIDGLNLLLDQVLHQLPIDTDRIYLTGLSMGGYATYEWASARPGTFAAIAPISGAGNPWDACALTRVPIWAFHGAQDDVVKTADDQAMVDAIKGCGGDIKFTVYPDLGHSAWEPAYQDPELYQWLLSHRLDHARARRSMAELAARKTRIHNQRPDANAEPTLRRLIKEYLAGKPDYSRMSPTLAAAGRENLAQVTAHLEKLGVLEKLSYRATGYDGTDLYEGKFANGKARLQLLLQAGKIINATLDPL